MLLILLSSFFEREVSIILCIELSAKLLTKTYDTVILIQPEKTLHGIQDKQQLSSDLQESTLSATINHKVNKMSTIDLYQVLRQIPNVTEEQAKQAAAGAEQTGRLEGIETRLANLETQVADMRIQIRITLGLQLIILVILLTPLLQ